MGGFGSGGWNYSGRMLTTQAPFMDANEAAKSGVLRPGARATWTWSRDGREIGAIETEASDGWLRLRYAIQTQCRERERVSEDVTVEWADCRMGGKRPYWHCPECERRVVTLFGRGRFWCRRCHGLVYPSQRERKPDRAQSRANKLRIRMGGEPGWGNIPARPKGMWHRTYERALETILWADDITNAEMAVVLGRIQRSEASRRKSATRRVSSRNRA